MNLHGGYRQVAGGSGIKGLGQHTALHYPIKPGLWYKSWYRDTYEQRKRTLKLTAEAKSHMPIDGIAYDSVRIENDDRETWVVYSYGGVDMAYVSAGRLVDFSCGQSLTISGMRGFLGLEFAEGDKGKCAAPKGTIEDSRYTVGEDDV